MFHAPHLPSLPILQGGMGIGISNWRLARAVSAAGQLGVVSGTTLDTVLVRRLQDGDPGGHMRGAMERFPIPGAAEQVLRRWFRPGGRPPGTPYELLPMPAHRMARGQELLHVLAAFVEVHLARGGHGGPIGINLLTKVSAPNLALLYGAMLAGVGFVLMGAGIPREIPAALDALARHRPATLRLEVEGGGAPALTFDPAAHGSGAPPELRRPRFLPIVSSHALATMLARKAAGGVDGLVIEGWTAGGHNAPPRGGMVAGSAAEPVYGERDRVELDRVRELGLPFWLAGGMGWPGRLAEARAAGAAGVQVGTLFAYCEESGMADEIKHAVLAHAARDEVRVRTAPLASPTGYPFKLVTWGAACGDEPPRPRVCDLGYLRTPYLMEGGRLGYRCASEPVEAYVAKGGRIEDTAGRRCLCNGLLATAGYAQPRGPREVEPPLVTSGDDLERIGEFLRGRRTYTAADVIAHLLGTTAA